MHFGLVCSVRGVLWGIIPGLGGRVCSKIFPISRRIDIKKAVIAYFLLKSKWPLTHICDVLVVVGNLTALHADI